MSFRLESDEAISDGMRRLLLERTQEIIDNLTSPEIKRDKGVHEARKNCKRVRAAYRLIRSEIGDEAYRRENARFRDTARLLAGARDSWVMVQTLDNLIADHADQLPPGAFAGVRQILLDRYEAVLTHQHETQKAIPFIVETMQDACGQIARLPFQRENFTVFRGGLGRVYRQGRVAMQQAYAHPSPEIFHEWRKRVKYLWHQIEILEALWPRLFSVLADELHTLADYLGDDHDLAVLRSLALERPAGFGDEQELMRLLRLIDQKRLGLESLARPLGVRLYFDSPAAFVDRLEAYWKAWQAEDEARQNKLFARLEKATPTTLPADSPLLTTAEMAVHLALTPEKVRQLIREQKLPACKVGNIWVISAGEGERSLAGAAGGWLSTRAAADLLGSTPSKIREKVLAGEIPALKVGTVWAIPAESLIQKK